MTSTAAGGGSNIQSAHSRVGVHRVNQRRLGISLDIEQAVPVLRRRLIRWWMSCRQRVPPRVLLPSLAAHAARLDFRRRSSRTPVTAATAADQATAGGGSDRTRRDAVSDRSVPTVDTTADGSSPRPSGSSTVTWPPYVGYPVLVSAFQRLAELGLPAAQDTGPVAPVPPSGALARAVRGMQDVDPGLAAFTEDQFAQR